MPMPALSVALAVADTHRAFFRDPVTGTRRILPCLFEPAANTVFETLFPGGRRLLGDLVAAFGAGPAGTRTRVVRSDGAQVYPPTSTGSPLPMSRARSKPSVDT